MGTEEEEEMKEEDWDRLGGVRKTENETEEKEEVVGEGEMMGNEKKREMKDRREREEGVEERRMAKCSMKSHSR